MLYTNAGSLVSVCTFKVSVLSFSQASIPDRLLWISIPVGASLRGHPFSELKLKKLVGLAVPESPDLSPLRDKCELSCFDWADRCKQPNLSRRLLGEMLSKSVARYNWKQLAVKTKTNPPSQGRPHSKIKSTSHAVFVLWVRTLAPAAETPSCFAQISTRTLLLAPWLSESQPRS